jgi:hypothetical protein
MRSCEVIQQSRWIEIIDRSHGDVDDATSAIESLLKGSPASVLEHHLQEMIRVELLRILPLDQDPVEKVEEGVQERREIISEFLFGGRVGGLPLEHEVVFAILLRGQEAELLVCAGSGHARECV